MSATCDVNGSRKNSEVGDSRLSKTSSRGSTDRLRELTLLARPLPVPARQGPRRGQTIVRGFRPNQRGNARAMTLITHSLTRMVRIARLLGIGQQAGSIDTFTPKPALPGRIPHLPVSVPAGNRANDSLVRARPPERLNWGDGRWDYRSQLRGLNISRSVPTRMVQRKKDASTGPTWAMLKMTAEEYYVRFEVILSELDPKHLHAQLGDKAVLLCWEKPNIERCHRRRVAEWFEQALRMIVPEFGFPREQTPAYLEMPSRLN